MLTEKDKAQLAQKGISEAQLQAQLECFVNGFPFLRLYAAASTERGITAIPEAEQAGFLKAWDDYAAEGHDIVKFVPASGAASRMFKNLFSFVGGENDVPTTDFEKTFFDRLPEAAYYADLDAACQRLHGKGVAALISEGQYKQVVLALLGADGLNYGQLPKGLLKFHSYPEGARTPFEEHLVEGALYAREKDGTVHVHYTVSPEHRALF